MCQCCHTNAAVGKKRRGKEWMVIGPGMDTPNKSTNRKCVEWDGSVVHPPPCTHLYLDDPHRKMILTHVVCGSSYIMYSPCVNACLWL